MRERELRLALICYGGVSLAVYMHGITKEVWLLARASREFNDNGEPCTGPRAVYRSLLEHIEARSGIRLRVLADIIAGSSAGGMNGIFLAEAIATGKSLEPLTDLWLDNADVEELLDPDARPLSAFTKFWATPLAWLILRRSKAVRATVAKEAQAEVARKLSQFVRARWFAPPFGGPGFTRLILDALDAMAKAPRGPVLLPPGHPLDLFVTMTDFHGHPETLRINSPREVTETEHRVSLNFSTRGRGVDQGIGHTAELSYAARATASFPGAFPPFHIAELDKVLAARGQRWPSRARFLRSAFPQRTAQGTAEDVVLIDGSVLANAPFAQAIRALRNRPARREVDRRFVYIDPLPGEDALHFGPKASKQGQVPGFLATLLGASSNIPREQPIRESLETIEARSGRIREMRAITENLRLEVEQTVETLLGRTLLLAWPTPRRVTAWREKAQERASKSAGFTYAAYGHLKLSGIIDDIMATVRRAAPEMDNDAAAKARAALVAELNRRGLDNLSSPAGGAKQAAIDFFRAFDLRFRIRRMRFLARRLAEDVEAASLAPEAPADAMHKAIFGILSVYLERETAEWLGADFAEAAANTAEAPSVMLDLLANRRALVEQDLAADTRFCTALAQLPPVPQRAMLLAYLGFPLYDIATLPLLQGEGLDEFDPVKVDRISPEDARGIRSGGTAATLRGMEFNNFGAFFSRAYRENDYLWGRLHGAERMIDILLSTLPAEAALPTETVDDFKRLLFLAIVQEEAPRLTSITALTEQLRRELAG